jgi:hypothetical protein
MKLLALVTPFVLAASLAPLVASADATGGISGTVMDRTTGKPVANAAVSIYQLPVPKHQEAVRLRSSLTNRRGFFADLGLEGGAYIVTANVAGRSSSCVVRNVYGGEVHRVKIVVSDDKRPPACEGPYVGNFDPDQTADVYRVH